MELTWITSTGLVLFSAFLAYLLLAWFIKNDKRNAVFQKAPLIIATSTLIAFTFFPLLHFAVMSEIPEGKVRIGHKKINSQIEFYEYGVRYIFMSDNEKRIEELRHEISEIRSGIWLVGLVKDQKKQKRMLDDIASEIRKKEALISEINARTTGKTSKDLSQ